jgi:hypothetical protein
MVSIKIIINKRAAKKSRDIPVTGRGAYGVEMSRISRFLTIS